MQLRPEARPASWEELDRMQRSAFATLIAMLDEAVKRLPRIPARSEDDPSAWLSNNRTSKTVFVSGQRGSGKTTLLASIIKHTLLNSVPPKDADQKTQERTSSLSQRVVWLEPLDMETMPTAANLLSAILARIDDSVRRFSHGTRDPETEPDYRPRGLLTAGPNYHDALLQLQRLQTDSALAWESNLYARQSQLDADTYAVEVARGERARLWINKKLEDALDALAEDVFRGSGIHSPLFVLPVDDVDLNPLACLELLRLLRMISVPRLFTILLGDVQVADLVLTLKLSNDLARVSPYVRIPELLGVQPVVVGTMAGDIAANALRKLLPPSQRIVLQEMTVVEGLNFRPLGRIEEDKRIHELMAGCFVTSESWSPLLLSEEQRTTVRAPSLRDFLLFDRQRLMGVKEPVALPKETSATDVETALYSAKSFFRATPRQLTDLWLVLERTAIQVSNNTSVSTQEQEDRVRAFQDLQAYFARQARESLAGNTSLSPLQRKIAVDAITQSASGRWEMHALPFVPSAQTYPMLSVHVPAPNVAIPNYEARFVASRHTSWRLEVVEDPSDRPRLGGRQPPRTLSERVAAELMILNDLLVLDESLPFPFLSEQLMLGQAADGPAGLFALRWTDLADPSRSALLPWPRAPLASFFENDLSIGAWNEAMGLLNLDSVPVEELLFRWIDSPTAIMLRNPLLLDPTNRQLRGRPLPWSDLAKRLETMIVRRGDVESRYITWLNRVALLLLPESGFKGSISLARNNHLVEFWKSERRTIQELRARRLATLAKEDMWTLVEECCGMSELSRDLAPSMRLIERYANKKRDPLTLKATRVAARKEQ